MPPTKGALAAPRHAFGLAVRIELVRRDGEIASRRTANWSHWNKRADSTATSRLLKCVPPQTWTDRLAALAHPRRLAIMKALADGASTHQQLAKAVRIKPGPLYFHVRHLERAGLLDVPERNLFQLTLAASDLLQTLPLVLIGLRPHRLGRKG